MPDSELLKKLREAETKGTSNFLAKLTGRPSIHEIINSRSSPFSPEAAQDKIFKHTWVARIMAGPFLLPIIIGIPCKPEAWWFDIFASFLILLFSGIEKHLSAVFGNYSIAITNQGIRVERDRYSWEQIADAFLLLPPGKGQYYKLVLAVKGGRFKTYDLYYYRNLEDGIAEAIKYYIRPHLPLTE